MRNIRKTFSDFQPSVFINVFIYVLDIIIGAPYEDDGRGSVYIYNGYYQGLWLKHSLKILGRSVDKDTFGFGASLCNAMDINRDNINGKFMKIKIQRILYMLL